MPLAPPTLLALVALLAVPLTGPNAQGTALTQVDATYDLLGNWTTRTLTRADGSTELETREVDALGRVQSHALTLGDRLVSELAHDYTADGLRRESRLTTGGELRLTSSYHFDDAGRVEGAGFAPGSLAPTTASFTYTPEGLPEQTVLGDGSLACRTYDAGDRLETLLHYYAGGTCETPSSQALRGIGYTYDARGDRVGIRETWSDGSPLLRFEAQGFAHDDGGRLVVAAYADEARAWSYNQNGNRTSERRIVPVPDVPPEHYLTAPGPFRHDRLRYDGFDQLVGIDDMLAGGAERASFQYDRAGRTRERHDAGGSRTYAWGPDGTLTDVQEPQAGSLGSYTYDADGLRRRKQSPAANEGERLSLYDDGALVAELDAGTLAPRLLYLSAGEVLGVVDYGDDPTGRVEWLHRDGMRSIVERTALDQGSGEARRVAGPFRYDAWGTLRDVSAPMPADGSTHLAYTGHVLDPETGLLYAKARYLVPELGRFLSQDVYEGTPDDAPSLHRFGYAHGAPLRFWDPTGYGVDLAEARRAAAEDSGRKYEEAVREFGPNSPEAALWRERTLGMAALAEDEALSVELGHALHEPTLTLAGMIATGPIGEYAATTKVGAELLRGLAVVAAADGTKTAIEGVEEGDPWKVLRGLSEATAGVIGVRTLTPKAPESARYRSPMRRRLARESGGMSPAEPIGETSEVIAPRSVAPSSNGGSLDVEEGSFSIIDWTGYPAGMPKPNGPMRVLTGEEYATARALANETNAALRAAHGLEGSGLHIHEIKPVKFGGSPTDPANKMLLPAAEHVGPDGVHPRFWAPLLRWLSGGGT